MILTTLCSGRTVSTINRDEALMTKREPVEIVLIAIPVLVEAAAVTLFIMSAAVWLLIIGS